MRARGYPVEKRIMPAPCAMYLDGVRFRSRSSLEEVHPTGQYTVPYPTYFTVHMPSQAPHVEFTFSKPRRKTNSSTNTASLILHADNCTFFDVRIVLAESQSSKPVYAFEIAAVLQPGRHVVPAVGTNGKEALTDPVGLSEHTAMKKAMCIFAVSLVSGAKALGAYEWFRMLIRSASAGAATVPRSLWAYCGPQCRDLASLVDKIAIDALTDPPEYPPIPRYLLKPNGTIRQLEQGSNYANIEHFSATFALSLARQLEYRDSEIRRMNNIMHSVVCKIRWSNNAGETFVILQVKLREPGFKPLFGPVGSAYRAALHSSSIPGLAHHLIMERREASWEAELQFSALIPHYIADAVGHDVSKMSPLLLTFDADVYHCAERTQLRQLRRLIDIVPDPFSFDISDVLLGTESSFAPFEDHGV